MKYRVDINLHIIPKHILWVIMVEDSNSTAHGFKRLFSNEEVMINTLLRLIYTYSVSVMLKAQSKVPTLFLVRGSHASTFPSFVPQTNSWCTGFIAHRFTSEASVTRGFRNCPCSRFSLYTSGLKQTNQLVIFLLVQNSDNFPIWLKKDKDSSFWISNVFSKFMGLKDLNIRFLFIKYSRTPEFWINWGLWSVRIRKC